MSKIPSSSSASSSFLAFKATVKKRENKQWKDTLIKLFDNGRLQCYRPKSTNKETFDFAEEIDIKNKLLSFSRSDKHRDCIEITVQKKFRRSTKHKFQFLAQTDYIAFMRYLEHFTHRRHADDAMLVQPNQDILRMQHAHVTVDDVVKARLFMAECPKYGKLSSGFVFPDFIKIVGIVRNLWEMFKRAPSIERNQLKRGIDAVCNVKEDALIYASNYVHIFARTQHQKHFIACLDLVFECAAFEANAELLPQTTHNKSVQDDVDVGKNIQQRFDVQILSAMKCALHNAITLHLRYLRDKFSHYNTELVFGDGDDLRVNHELSAVYLMHDVFKFVETLRQKHEKQFMRTLSEFFEVADVHRIVARVLADEVMDFLAEQRSDVQRVLGATPKVLTVKQVQLMFQEMTTMFAYFGAHGITNEERTFLEPFKDYFITDFAARYEVVAHVLEKDTFEAIRSQQTTASECNDFTLHSTSPTDLFYSLEPRVKFILRLGLNRMQMVQLAESITSLLLMYISMVWSLADTDIENGKLRLHALSLSHQQDHKRDLKELFFGKRKSTSSHRRSTVLGVEANNDVVIKPKLLVMIGNILFLKQLFSRLQTELDFEQQYLSSDARNEALDEEDDEKQDTIAAEIVSVLKATKFYAAVEETLINIAHKLAAKLNDLVSGAILKNIENVQQNNNGAVAVAFHVTQYIGSILALLGDIPSDLSQFQQHLTHRFVSDFLTQFERLLVPTNCNKVLGHGAVLHMKQFMAEFGTILDQFGLNRLDYHELRRMDAIIEVQLLSTQKLIALCAKLENPIKSSKEKPETREFHLSMQEILYLLQYRSQRNGDTDATQFLKEYQYRRMRRV